jgi:hypothetical protein
MLNSGAAGVRDLTNADAIDAAPGNATATGAVVGRLYDRLGGIFRTVPGSALRAPQDDIIYAIPMTSRWLLLRHSCGLRTVWAIRNDSLPFLHSNGLASVDVG